MKLPFLSSIPHPSLHIPAAGEVVPVFNRFAKGIFWTGLVISVFLGVGVFYFFGYRVTQQPYRPDTRLEEINIGLLQKALDRLEGQKTTATQAPRDVFH